MVVKQTWNLYETKYKNKMSDILKNIDGEIFVSYIANQNYEDFSRTVCKANKNITLIKSPDFVRKIMLKTAIKYTSKNKNKIVDDVIETLTKLAIKNKSENSYNEQCCVIWYRNKNYRAINLFSLNLNLNYEKPFINVWIDKKYLKQNKDNVNLMQPISIEDARELFTKKRVVIPTTKDDENIA